MLQPGSLLFFFFNDPATPKIYPLSLHDALPIPAPKPLVHDAAGKPGDGRHPRAPSARRRRRRSVAAGEPRRRRRVAGGRDHLRRTTITRSEEHTSELQSQSNLVCRLLLEKKKNE